MGSTEQGQRYETCRLPGMIKAPHEAIRQSCERLLKTLNLQLDQVSFSLEQGERSEEEYESASYPGLMTLYNREVIEGVVQVASMTPEQLKSIGLPDMATWTSRDRRWGTKFNQWMTQEEALANNLQCGQRCSEANSSALVHAPIGMNEQELRARLSATGIDVNKFGQNGTRTLKDFSQELHRGEAFVQDVSGELVRTVNVVVIILSDPGTGRTLVQTRQMSIDGSGGTENARLPGNKCRPDENHFICARRIIRRELEIDDTVVHFDENVRFVEEQQPSTNYLGLKTIYRKFLISAHL